MITRARARARAFYVVITVLAVVIAIEWVSIRRAQKRALEARLLAAEIQKRSDVIMNIMPAAVIMCDERGVVTFCNEEVTSILGWTAIELVGFPLNKILPPDMSAMHTPKQKKFIENLRTNKESVQVTLVIKGAAINHNHERVSVIVRMRAMMINDRVYQIAIIAPDLTAPSMTVEPLNASASAL